MGIYYLRYYKKFRIIFSILKKTADKIANSKEDYSSFFCLLEEEPKFRILSPINVGTGKG